MRTIEPCTVADYPTLVEIWERSVRATHNFLTETDIREIRQALIPCYFPEVNLFVIKDNRVIKGFIGLRETRIEMLFIDSCCHGCGYGTSLIEFALTQGCRHVDVNEQNPSALRFYCARGFKVDSRDELDECGRPFPILHLSLPQASSPLAQPGNSMI